MTNKTYIKEAINAIDKVFSNMSVPDTTTLSDLEEIQCELEGKIEALKEQIKNREDQS